MHVRYDCMVLVLIEKFSSLSEIVFVSFEHVVCFCVLAMMLLCIYDVFSMIYKVFH